MEEPKKSKTESLNPNDILTAEFEYIAQCAFQANEDRARVSTFYLVASGSFIAAILGFQFDHIRTPALYWAFSVFFSILSAAGFLTLLQLVRLRKAWIYGAKAMNRIKDFYQNSLNQPDLKQALLWNDGNLPRAFKMWSVSHLMAIQVTIMSSLLLGAAVMFIGLACMYKCWIIAICTGVVYLAFQLFLYWFMLRKV